MKSITRIFSALVVFLISVSLVAQDKKSMDATKIAGDYYNSIVKILLLDSAAEKKSPGSGYLGRGSGFLVTEDGYIFTNRHVIDYCLNFMRYTYYDASDRKIHEDGDAYNEKAIKDPAYLAINYISKAAPIIQVYTDKYGNYKLYYARVVALDTANFDGAILKIVCDINGSPVANNFHPAPIGNSDSTNQGEDLCVYGFPAQYDAGFDIMLRDQSTLTFGKHSGNDFVYNPQYGFIKTDASINGGNSGGPVFNQSNKVIGLASKTIDKTNTGLIGGINAMYNLAALNPELLKVLVEKGLTAPERKLNVNSAVLSPSVLIPSQKEIKQSNILKRNVRNFKGGTWYFKGSTPIYQGDKFRIDPISDARDSKIATTNSGAAPLSVKMKRAIGFEIGHLFTIWRISPTHKLSLDWTLASVTYGAMDWSNANLYKDTAGSAIVLNSSAKYYRIGTRLGLNYSFIFSRQFTGHGYYKASVIEENGSELSYSTNDSLAGRLPSATSDYFFAAPLVLHSFGFNIGYKIFMIGMEYSFGKTSLEYTNLSSFFHTTNNVGFSNFGTSGYRSINTLNFTFGIALNGKKKWKKLLRREYRHSLNK